MNDDQAERKRNLVAKVTQNPFFVLFVVVAGIASIVSLGFFIYFEFFRDSGQLELRITSKISLPSADEQFGGAFGGKLRFTYDGNPLISASSVTEATFVNRSDRALKVDDFRGPIVLTVVNGDIVDSEIVKSEPEQLGLSITSGDASTLLIRLEEQFKFLKKGDLINFRILINDSDPEFDVDGDTSIGKPRLVDPLALEPQSSTPWWRWLLSPAVAILVSIIVYFIGRKRIA